MNMAATGSWEVALIRRWGLVGVVVAYWGWVSNSQARSSVSLFLLPADLDVEL